MSPRAAKSKPGLAELLRAGRLDEQTTARAGGPLAAPPAAAGPDADAKARRWLYARAYLRWLWPHRRGALVVFGLALVAAGLDMVQPLFMRTIIDGVLLNTALDGATRLQRLNVVGGLFVLLVVSEQLVTFGKDYRQKVLNTRIMLSLRRALFDKLLHLPLPRLWDMKTGGILSRLTGDVDTTTGLLQMAVMSPSISVVRFEKVSSSCWGIPAISGTCRPGRHSTPSECDSS